MTTLEKRTKPELSKKKSEKMRNKMKLKTIYKTLLKWKGPGRGHAVYQQKLKSLCLKNCS